MITSDKQYNEALKKIEMLQGSLLLPKKTNIPEIIAEAGKSQIHELIEHIQNDIKEFEKYRDTDIAIIEIHSIDDLMKTPIRYRLAEGMSIDVFAQLVGISPRQINRYEKECYQNSHSSTLKAILKKLKVEIDGRISESDAVSRDPCTQSPSR